MHLPLLLKSLISAPPFGVFDCVMCCMRYASSKGNWLAGSLQPNLLVQENR